MGTGPRGGRRVREAAEAAAREAAAAAETAAPETAAPDDAPAAKRPKGDAAPPPKTGGSVDPADVDRKSTQVLVKKGYAEAAVARAMAAARPTADDLAQSFNEQKRRRTAAASEWLAAHAEPWELPTGAGSDARASSANPPAASKPPDPAADLDDDPVELANMSERARDLVAKGLLPISEAHVLREPRVRTDDETARAVPVVGGAGAGAQDRARTGKSLRARKAEKAERRAADLCPRLARGEPCEHGDACERSHDVDSFVKNKPGDIPGTCPFVTRTVACPYGMRCRLAGTHASPDGDASGPEPERNVVDDETRRDLARNLYPLPRSDAILREMNVPVRCLSKTQAKRRDATRGSFAPPREPKRREGFVGGGKDRDRAPRLDFRGKLIVAPLTTVGNAPFRRVCVGMGADVTVSEMAMASNLLKGDRSEWALVRRHPSERCFGVQICGGWPDLMARCGELLDTETDCDFVDINMGCPIDGVCAKGAGSSLLRDAEGLERMATTVRAASRSMRRTPLTIKIRMGYEDDPASWVAHDVVSKAKGWGAAAVTLHGRTRQQRYSRRADWAYVRKCASAAAKTGLPLIGNGDVFGWRDYERRMSGGDVATCMIGRGALIKPWVLTEIKERRVWDISANERLDVFRDFARFGLEHWGSDETGVETTRRFMMEWMSYTHRYVPVGLLERGVTQGMHLRPVPYSGRNELETLLASDAVADWSKVAEMFLGKPAPGFSFVPKHRSNSYSSESAAALRQFGAGTDQGGEEEDEEENG